MKNLYRTFLPFDAERGWIGGLLRGVVPETTGGMGGGGGVSPGTGGGGVVGGGPCLSGEGGKGGLSADWLPPV